jgi:hypothetical protein
MTDDSRAAFYEDPNYIALKSHYKHMPLALFSGAGVAVSASKKFGIGEWDELLRRIAVVRMSKSKSAQYWHSAKSLKPWDQAQLLADSIGKKALQQEIVHLVRKKENFQTAYSGLLTSPFLRDATTLGAMAAFCALLAGFSVGKGQAYYARVVPNPRVPAVISTNYDCFLEAAASLMFRTITRKYLLKPVSARGSTAGIVGQIPVFHVHGYVSPRENDKETVEPFVDPVVTRADYEAAWEDNAYSPTIGPQVHVLRHYATLFVGFSFRDEWVNGVLKNLEEERRGRPDRIYHYALVSADTLKDKGPLWFERHGIRAIAWKAPEEIVQLFGDLYLSGLHHTVRQYGGIDLVQFEVGRSTVQPTGKLKRVHSKNIEYCWNMLLASRLGRIPKAPP